MILRTVETLPPAKLNLYLEILGKRPDGYHELETVMTAVDRCDHLRVSLTEDPAIHVDCYWSPSANHWRQLDGNGDMQSMALPAMEQNLVYRALAAFRTRYEVRYGFKAELAKRIPAGAGMGGASSDAASALLCAAELVGIPAADPGIDQLAAELGSDIPFFLGAGGTRSGTALCSGRGERRQALSGPRDRHFVVVYPPQPLSTAAVFGKCVIPKDPQASDSVVQVVQSGNLASLTNAIFNRLTEPARELSEWIDKTLHALHRVDLDGVTMTGSGSACFGMASSTKVARRATAVLSGRRSGVCFTAGQTCLPAKIRFLT